MFRRIQETHPRHSVKLYSAMTSTSVLRAHLVNSHLDEYETACRANGWLALLNRLNRNTEAAPDPSPRTPFSDEEFMKAIIKFICADDQVRAISVFEHSQCILINLL